MDEIERLRALCAALPEVAEKLSHGEPAWFVRRRMFVMFAGRHHDERVGFWCAAPPGAQEELVDGQRYFRPPYVGHRGGSACTSTCPSTGPRSSSSSRTPTGPSRPRP